MKKSFFVLLLLGSFVGCSAEANPICPPGTYGEICVPPESGQSLCHNDNSGVELKTQVRSQASAFYLGMSKEATEQKLAIEKELKIFPQSQSLRKLYESTVAKEEQYMHTAERLNE